MTYQIYLTWWGYTIVRHDKRGIPRRQVAVFDDSTTATAVMRDLNKGVK